MKILKFLIPKLFLILLTNQIILCTPKVKSADNIKIIYSIFSRTVTVDSLKISLKKEILQVN